ncbi:MAG: HAD family hydrolase [Cyclobacteriaceae bacterium]|nr:HAD family hydrolase [Cyclobacteriaceae bacterium]
MLNIYEKCKKIKLVASDIDGVWTDGSMYYGALGEELKRFSTYDGMAVELLRKARLDVVVLTGENSMAVAKRMEKLNVEHYYYSQTNKLDTMRQFVERYGISLNEVAYIGDDVNDLELLSQVGVSGMPCNSYILDRFLPDYITVRPGGSGAFRDFVEFVLQGKNI